jgi:transposase InsO family protein
MKIQPLCGLFGISRQAYYQRREGRGLEKEALCSIVIEYVREVRMLAPRTGCEKLYVMCRTFFGSLFTLGRDAFYRLLREYGLMLRLKKRSVRTTDSSHPYPRYPDLAKGFIPVRACELWVADITYVRLSEGGFCFLSMVTDAYSRRIRGWKLAPTLEYAHTLKALEMAVEDCGGHPPEGLIHHSDRGGQYAHESYISLLRRHGIRSSMTQSGDPRDNAMAERVNGTVKQECLRLNDFETVEQVQGALEKFIDFYNTRRPHASIDFLTPMEAEKREGPLRNRWKRKNGENALCRALSPPACAERSSLNV